VKGKLREKCAHDDQNPAEVTLELSNTKIAMPMDLISDGGLFFSKGSEITSAVLRKHRVAFPGECSRRTEPIHSPANQRKKTSAGHLTGFFSGRISEKEQLRPARALSRRETAAR